MSLSLNLLPIASVFPSGAPSVEVIADYADQYRVHFRLRRIQVRRHSPHLPLSSRPRPNPKYKYSINDTERHSIIMAQRGFLGILQRVRDKCVEDITGDVYHFCGLREFGLGV